jgi:hypothetical protein
MPRYFILTELEATAEDIISDSRNTLTPFGRVLRGMEHGVNGHDISRVLVENGVRKAAR